MPPPHDLRCGMGHCGSWISTVLSAFPATPSRAMSSFYPTFHFSGGATVPTGAGLGLHLLEPKGCLNWTIHQLFLQPFTMRTFPHSPCSMPNHRKIYRERRIHIYVYSALEFGTFILFSHKTSCSHHNFNPERGSAMLSSGMHTNCPF